MASPVPATVPSMAQTVFFLMPPKMVRLTTAMYAQRKNTVGRVGSPFISSGSKTQNRQARVRASPTRDFAPVFPPTNTAARRNSTAAKPSAPRRSYSNTVAVWLPSA